MVFIAPHAAAQYFNLLGAIEPFVPPLKATEFSQRPNFHQPGVTVELRPGRSVREFARRQGFL